MLNNVYKEFGEIYSIQNYVILPSSNIFVYLLVIMYSYMCT